jgi:hypothetical protein
MPRFAVGAGLAGDGGLTADQSLSDAPHSPVGAGLPAMAARQPTSLSQMHPIPLWELACQRWRPASRPISRRCTPNPVGAGLPAMTPCQPPNLLQMYPEPCGSWPAGDGGPPADQSLSDAPHSPVGAGLPAMAARQPTSLSQMHPIPLWELACQRWRPASRPISCRFTPNPVGAGLPAKAACQSTNLLQVYTEPCGSWPAGDGGLTVAQSLAGVHQTLWELACQRWRPASRPISCRCTPNPVGAGLPAMAA